MNCLPANVLSTGINHSVISETNPVIPITNPVIPINNPVIPAKAGIQPVGCVPINIGAHLLLFEFRSGPTPRLTTS